MRVDYVHAVETLAFRRGQVPQQHLDRPKAASNTSRAHGCVVSIRGGDFGV